MLRVITGKKVDALSFGMNLVFSAILLSLDDEHFSAPQLIPWKQFLQRIGQVFIFLHFERLTQVIAAIRTKIYVLREAI